MPIPSCQMILIRSPLAPRKTYKSPACGSRPSACCTCKANPFMPLRMSVRPTASHTRTPEGTGIIAAPARADQAVERAMDRYAVSRERNVAELARMAYANMADYTRRTPEGELVVDFSNADRDALAAVQEVVVEDFVDGRGDDARDVRRVRFKLAAKQGAIERLNRMFGWEIDRQEVKRVDEFSTMSRDELAEYIRTGRKPTREAGETRH